MYLRCLKRRKRELYAAACGESMTEAWVYWLSMSQMTLRWWTDTALDPLLDVAVAPTDILGVKSLFAGKPPFQSEHLGHFVRASTGINGSAFAPTLSSATH